LLPREGEKMSIEDMKRIAGYAKLAEFLTENGYPTGKQTIYKICARGEGPPHGQWGTRCLFNPTEVLAWARDREQGAKQVTAAPEPIAARASRPAAGRLRGSKDVPQPAEPAPRPQRAEKSVSDLTSSI